MDILAKLMQSQDAPCVSISLRTHRTHPDNQQDGILLKKLIREAELRLVEDFGKRDSADLVEKLLAIPDTLNMSYNLDSMHIFVSSSINEVVKLAIPVSDDSVQIGEHFAVRPLLKSLNRTENYLILLLSEGGARLFEAINDEVIREFDSHGFPFPENPHVLTQAAQRSDAKKLDNQLREYLNTIDKAVNDVHQELELDCIVVTVEANYHMLHQVADKPSIYLGHVNKNYKERKPHHLANESWELMTELLSERRIEAIEEMKEAVGQSKVVTDLGEIYRAAKEGRGDMLIAYSGFRQAVVKVDELTINLATGDEDEEVIDDIMSELAMEVYTKNGRVVFADEAERSDLPEIALKLRY